MSVPLRFPKTERMRYLFLLAGEKNQTQNQD